MSTPNEPNWQQPEYSLRPEPPLAARAEPSRATRPSPGREESLRRVRRLTNWSLAALLVALGATSATLAHVIPGHSAPVLSGTSQRGVGPASTTSGRAPTLSGSVASSSGSQVVAGGGVTGSQGSSQPGAASSPGAVSSGSSWSDS